MFQAEIITIGDELLLGQTINTNAADIAKALTDIGIDIRQVSTIGDDTQQLPAALRQAEQRASLIILTGGLGPTKDDKTKSILANYFQTTLRNDPATLEHVSKLMLSRGIEMNTLNVHQADVLANAEILFNVCGTAPGMWIAHNDHYYVCMPGVPFEMRRMLHEQLIPKIQSTLNIDRIEHRNFLIEGIAESSLAVLLNSFEEALPPHLSLAYLPTDGIIRLRLTAKAPKDSPIFQQLDLHANTLRTLLIDNLPPQASLLSTDHSSLLDLATDALLRANATIATAESCTAGRLSAALTQKSGSSAYFLGGIAAYHNHIKTKLLNVPTSILEQHGAVSEQTAIAMAEGARALTGATYALSTTGIAGPTGATPSKPVGLVYIALATPKKTIVIKKQWGNDREANLKRAVAAALTLLIKNI